MIDTAPHFEFFRRLSFVAVVLVTFVGCNRELPVTKNVTGSNDEPARLSVARLESGDKPAIVDSHSFGVVRPGSENVHNFRIANITTRTWKIVQIINTCACIVSEVDNESIKPGDSVELMVKYRAPSKEVADRRRVYVAFEDPTAPIIALEVRALVREEVHVFPKRLTMTEVRIGEMRIENITLANYGGLKWEKPDFRSSADWLTLKPTSCTPDELEPAEQRYELMAEVDTRSLPPGRGSATITVSEKRGDKVIELAVIPVDITCLAWGTLIPPDFFVGKVTAGSVQRDVDIRLAEPLKNGQQLVLSTDGLDGIRLVNVASPSSTQLRATIEFIAPDKPGFYTRTLTYSLGTTAALPPLHQKLSFLVE